MRFIQVGVGSFGHVWLENVLLKRKECEVVAVVDTDVGRLEELIQMYPILENKTFTDLDVALDTIQADALLNTTPPQYHEAVMLAALKYCLPILTEKPLTVALEQAKFILEEATRKGVPIMVAENYRYSNRARFMKQCVENSVLGQINRVSVKFYRRHQLFNYHNALKHPLLLDVAIHHLDVIRYVLDQEMTVKVASAWNPSWSWYDFNSNLSLQLVTEDRTLIEYSGCLAAPIDETDWFADYRIEGEKCVMNLKGFTISLKGKDIDQEYMIDEDENTLSRVMDEFILSIHEKREGLTCIRDNIKTLELIQQGIKKCEEIYYV